MKLNPYRQIRRLLRGQLALVRALRRYRMRRAQPDWRHVRGNPPTATNRPPTSSPVRILVATSTGGLKSAICLESLLAMALAARGAEVELLLCDGALPACQLCKNDSANPELDFNGTRPWACPECYPLASKALRHLGLRIHTYSEHITAEAAAEARRIAATTPLDEIPTFTYRGVSLGEDAVAGALRFFGRGDLTGAPGEADILRRYLEAALRTASAIDHLLSSHHYECAVFHHGIYVPQGVIGAVCRERQVRVVNWAVAYRDQSFIFSHDHSHHRTLPVEPVESWRDRPLSSDERADLRRYLQSRHTGRDDWISFVGTPSFDVARFCRRTGLDQRPRIGLLTSVSFDARIHYPSNAFPSMMAWIVTTIEYFARRPDLQLVIRVHPAEVNKGWPSSERVADNIRRRFTPLPDNVVIVEPDDPISTYALMDTCDSVLIYNTKTGIELSASGIPVVVAGEAWIRGKGFTQDAKTPEEYLALLAMLPRGRRLSAQAIDLAERYAYHLFFRRMVPLAGLLTTGRDADFRHALTDWVQLSPGRHRGLDVICDGILRGTPFVYPDDAPRT